MDSVELKGDAKPSRRYKCREISTPIFFVENFFRRKFFSSKFFSTKVNFRPKRFSTKKFFDEKNFRRKSFSTKKFFDEKLFCLLNRMNGFLEKNFQYLEAYVTTLILLINIFTYSFLTCHREKILKPVHSIHPSKLFFRRKKFSTKKTFDEKSFRRKKLSTKKIFDEKNRCQ